MGEEREDGALQLREAAQQSRAAVARQTDRHRDVLATPDASRDQQIATDHDRVTAQLSSARRSHQEALANLRQREHAVAAQAR